MNTFGNIYRLTSFGESHGPAIGGVIDGLPPRTVISLREVQRALDARRPGGGSNTSQRREPDRLHILSGLMGLNEAGELLPLAADTDLCISLGTPIGFYVENTDARPADYEPLKDLIRPNHADLTYLVKYEIRDWRGGGRASGRETIARVVAGAFASQLLVLQKINVKAAVTAIGGCDNPREFDTLLRQAREDGDSLGGVVSVEVSNMPPGLGEPLALKLQAMLSSALFSIGGVHGVEYGDGFALSAMRGSEAADEMTATDGLLSNHCGGILGGISTGQPLTFRVAFKPTPSISMPLRTLTTSGEDAIITTNGRHDPCIAIRGAAVVKAMVEMTLLDAILLSGYKL